MGKTCVVDDDRLGLMLSDDLVKCVFFPILVRLGPVAVEPQTADLAVFGAEDFNGIAQILQICLEIVVEARIVPVKGGVIEERNDADIVAGIDIFADEVTADGAVRCVVGVQTLGIEQREALVVTGRQRDVLRTCRLCRFCDLVRIELGRGEGVL